MPPGAVMRPNLRILIQPTNPSFNKLADGIESSCFDEAIAVYCSLLRSPNGNPG
jgi:hypothetical protein